MLGATENGFLLPKRAGRGGGIVLLGAVALGIAAAALITYQSFTQPSTLLEAPANVRLYVNNLASEVGKLKQSQNVLSEEREVYALQQKLQIIKADRVPYDGRVTFLGEQLNQAKQRLANSMLNIAERNQEMRSGAIEKPTNQLGFTSGSETHNYVNDANTWYRCATHGKWGLEPCVAEYVNDTYFPLVPGVWQNTMDVQPQNIQDFAWSQDDDPVIGDYGSKRYRPTFYVDWDGSGREMPHTDTMTEESFGAPYAAPRRNAGLAAGPAAQLTKLDIPDDFDPVGGAAGYPIETAQHANGQQNYGPGASRPDDENIPAYDFWYASKGRTAGVAHQQLATSDKSRMHLLKSKLQNLKRQAATAAVSKASKSASPKQEQILSAAARDALYQERAQVAKLDTFIAQAQEKLATVKQQHTTAKKALNQGLSMRQDREGDYALLSLGRYHGCAPSPITGVPADDCEPLAARMEADAAVTAAQLAAARTGYAGVHWRSGDVDPREDAFPSREQHGGYSGMADIEFPADKVQATMYRPVLNGYIDPSTVTTKAVGGGGAAAAQLRTAADAAALRMRIAVLGAAEEHADDAAAKSTSADIPDIVAAAVAQPAAAKIAAAAQQSAAGGKSAAEDMAVLSSAGDGSPLMAAEKVVEGERRLAVAAEALVDAEERKAERAQAKAYAARLEVRAARREEDQVRGLLSAAAGNGVAAAAGGKGVEADEASPRAAAQTPQVPLQAVVRDVVADLRQDRDLAKQLLLPPLH